MEKTKISYMVMQVIHEHGSPYIMKNCLVHDIEFKYYEDYAIIYIKYSILDEEKTYSLNHNISYSIPYKEAFNSFFTFLKKNIMNK